MLVDHQNQWTSHKSAVHFTSSTLHLVAVRIAITNLLQFPMNLLKDSLIFLCLNQVSLWSVLVLSYSSDGYVCIFRCCCQRENQLPKGETVSEMLNATDMTESPQRQSLLSPSDASGTKLFLLNILSNLNILSSLF